MPKENDLYIKKCKYCGLTFRTDKPRVKICPSCRIKNRKESQLAWNSNNKKTIKDRYNMPGIPSLSINEMCKVIRAYNKKHNTTYSYGQFVTALWLGQIEI